MSTAHSLPGTTATRDTHRGLLRIAQVLMIGPLGALVIFGSVYFGLIAPTEETMSAFDWFVGSWAFVMGIASIVLGSRLVTGDDGVRRAALGLVALHAVFGVVKIVFYAETEALTFMAVDAIVIGLLARVRR